MDTSIEQFKEDVENQIFIKKKYIGLNTNRLLLIKIDMCLMCYLEGVFFMVQFNI